MVPPCPSSRSEAKRDAWRDASAATKASKIRLGSASISAISFSNSVTVPSCGSAICVANKLSRVVVSPIASIWKRTSLSAEACVIKYSLRSTPPETLESIISAAIVALSSIWKTNASCAASSSAVNAPVSSITTLSIAAMYCTGVIWGEPPAKIKSVIDSFSVTPTKRSLLVFISSAIVWSANTTTARSSLLRAAKVRSGLVVITPESIFTISSGLNAKTGFPLVASAIMAATKLALASKSPRSVSSPSIAVATSSLLKRVEMALTGVWAKSAWIASLVVADDWERLRKLVIASSLWTIETSDCVSLINDEKLFCSVELASVVCMTGLERISSTRLSTANNSNANAESVSAALSSCSWYVTIPPCPSSTLALRIAVSSVVSPVANSWSATCASAMDWETSTSCTELPEAVSIVRTAVFRSVKASVPRIRLL